MNVLIADKAPDWFVKSLEEAGCNVRWDASLEGAALTQAIVEHQPSALLVRSTKVQVEQLDATDTLKLVVRAGAGVNTIDTGVVTYLNAKFEEIYGWPQDEFPNIADFFVKVFPDPEERARVHRAAFEEHFCTQYVSLTFPRIDARTVDRYRDQYRSIRGEDFAISPKPVFYLGHIPNPRKRVNR